MSLETIVADLATATEALHTAISDKKTVLDNAAQQAAVSLTTAQGHQTTTQTKVTEAAASATAAANALAQVTAYKTAATALNTATTATQAVTNLLPDMLAKKDPARHPFRNKQPTLVLDFERQKCHRYSPSTGFGETPLLPFMTFARNSAATYTGPDGLIKTAAANEARFDYDPLTGECKGLLVEEQRTNLLTYSASMSSSAFGKNALGLGVTPTVRPNYAVAPDGTLTAARVALVAGGVTAGDRSFLQVNIPTDNVQRTLAVYLKSATSQTYTVASRCNGTSISSVVTPFVWTRVFVSGASAVDNTGYVCSVYGGGAVATSASADLLVWGAQLETGAFPTSYIPTPAVFSARASTATYLDANGVVQTAASGVARSNAYDYDSDGVLRPIGLLLEASATNKLLYSEQFDNAAWNKNAVGVGSAPVVTANYGTAPDGTNTADRIVFALNGSLDVVDRSELRQYVNTIAGSSYVQSIWLKTTDGSTKTIQISFDAEAPKLLTITGTWQRFSNVDPAASDTIRGFRLCLRGATGTSDSADLLVWGAQQGVGGYPTSYIPTTSAQVTRAADTSTSAQATRVADDAKVDGTKFSDFYNQSQGTAVSEFSIAGLGGVYYPGVFSVDNGGVNDRFGYCVSDSDSDKVALNVRVNAIYATPYFSDQGVTPNQTTKASVRVSRSGWAGAIKDTASVGSGSGKVIQSMTRLSIGKFDSWANGCIKNFIYYPQPFTNEELQTFTAP